jgi:hypothetical protein
MANQSMSTDVGIVKAAVTPNMRLKLSGWGGHMGRRRSILIVAAPARSLSATR